MVDTETATYENILFNDDISNFVGSFTCELSNVRNTAQDTVELNGELFFVNFLILFCLYCNRCVHCT